MHILRVEIEGVGPFQKKYSVNFSEKDLNLVYGPNESGKSTLVEAIYATVFGFERKEDEQAFKSWSPSDQYTGLVEFSTANGTVQFFRDFSSNRVTVTLEDNGKQRQLFSGDASPRSRSEEKRAYLDIVRQYFGFSDGSLARRTSIVRQLDLRTEFTPELRGLISGAGPTDYQGALELLKARFEDLTVENPWGRVARRKVRAIEEAEESLSQAQLSLEKSEAFFAHNVSLGKESDQLEKEIKELKEKSVQKKESLARIARLVELQNNLKSKQKLLRSEHAAKEDFERVRKTCEGAREKLEREYPLFKNLKTELSPTLSKLASVEEKITSAEKELSEEEVRLGAAPRPVPAWVTLVASCGTFILFLGIGALTGRLALATGLGVLLAIVVALGLLFFSGRNRRYLPRKTTVEEIRKRLSDLITEKGRLKEDILQSFADDQIRIRVDGMSTRDLATHYGGFREAKKIAENFERELLGRQSGAGGESYAAAVRDAAIAEERLEQFLKEQDELLSLKDDPEKSASAAALAKRESEDIERRLAESEEKHTDKRIEHAAFSASQVSPPEIYQEEIERLKKSLAKLTLRRDALKLAVKTLDECVVEYQAGSIERVADRISEVFDTITQGRYKSVRLSPGLKPVLETSLNAEIDPEQISTGAKDQLYFSMRIAMLEELSGEKGWPLILDDPFVNFDDRRLERARDLLFHLANQRDMQIIIFTHGERDLPWNANIIPISCT